MGCEQIEAVTQHPTPMSKTDQAQPPGMGAPGQLLCSHLQPDAEQAATCTAGRSGGLLQEETYSKAEAARRRCQAPATSTYLTVTVLALHTRCSLLLSSYLLRVGLRDPSWVPSNLGRSVIWQPSPRQGLEPHHL